MVGARALYHEHKGWLMINAANLARGDSGSLTDAQRETVKATLAFYGDRDADELSLLTHAEEPWIEARKGLAPDQPGDVEITREAMKRYYGQLAGTPKGPSSPALLAHLHEGVADAREGRIVSRGSFAKYLDD